MTENNNANNPPADAEAGAAPVVAAAPPPPAQPAPPPSALEENKVEEAPKGKTFKIKHISAALSLASFVLSLPILASAIWLLYMRDYDCEELLNLPRVQVGISVGLLAVFLICNLALFLRTRLPLAAVLFAVVPLCVMFIVGLGFIGAYKLESAKIPASPMWFRKKINDESKWNQVKSCIYQTRICQELARKSLEIKSYRFSIKELSPVEYGCCRPPKSCEMEAMNATYWKKAEVTAENGQYPHDADCDRWTNDRTVLCFDCHSCKQGFVTTLQSKWSNLGVFQVIMSLLLTLSHICLFVASTWEHLAL